MSQREAQKRKLKRHAILKAKHGKKNASVHIEGEEQEQVTEGGRYIRYAAMAQTVFSIILTFAMWFVTYFRDLGT
jgi:hypothetical protein